jgi:EAL domain-containing protein (putative c-di-GMP-specific phosphodiesterase class I)
MGLQVIAEGIEDLDQADWLREHGCEMAQGYTTELLLPSRK